MLRFRDEERNEVTVGTLLFDAFESLPDGIAIQEANGRTSFVNGVQRRRFPTFYAALDAGVPYGEAILASITVTRPDAPADEREGLAAAFVARYGSGQPYETLTEDGRIVRITYQPMTEERRVLISVDITELRHREEELTKLEAAAIAASNAKSAFLANMSHEIRTPLNGIMGMAQVLQTSTMPVEQREQVSTILDSGHSLMAILNDVLDLSKIEAGRLSIVRADADIAHVLQSLCRLWKPKADEAGLEFRLTLSDDLPQILNFDAGRVRQCISNLISNAIKFTRRGRVEISVDVTRQSADSHLVKVQVSDTGPGLDAETQGRLFQPFEQASVSTAQVHGGTGLGLSIVRNLAQMMDGETTVWSELGRGSTFTFSFLAGEATSPEAGDSKRMQSVVEPNDGAREIRNLRVLLVDDHPVNRQVAKLVLGPFDMHIVEAVNGQEALVCLDAEDFDIVLLDMHMPVLDGPETISAIRASSAPWQGVPVIALTADAMSGDRERYMRLGCDGYVSKPLAIHELVSEMARVRSLAMLSE